MSNFNTTRLVSVVQKKGPGDFNELIDMQNNTIWSTVYNFCLSNNLKIKSYMQVSEAKPVFLVDTFEGHKFHFKIQEARKL